MKKLLRIMLCYFRLNLASALEYRASFLLQAFGMALSNSSFIFFWWIAFQQIGGRIAGYAFEDVLFIWAACSSLFGVSSILFANVSKLTGLIVTGELDTYLLQPCNVVLNVICARTSLSSYGDLAYGFILIAAAYGANATVWLWFLIAVAVGSLLITATALAAHSLTFFLGNANLIGSMGIEFVINFCIYPKGIYGGIVRALMYTLIPAAFMVHVPLELAQSFSWPLAAALAASVFVYGGFAVWLFYRGLLRYESGNAIAMRQ